MSEAREAAMRRHPSGQHVPHTPDRIQALIDAAQDEQALELANRERSDLEAWGMAPVRRVNEKHHDATTAGAWWVHVVGPAGLAAFIIITIVVAALLGEIAGGWPA